MDAGVAARDLWLDALVAPDLAVETRVCAAEELRTIGAVEQGYAEIDKAALQAGLTNAEADRLARLRQWLSDRSRTGANVPISPDT